MTAADKLRELLATRPAMPNTEELVRWWRSTGLLLPQLFDDMAELRERLESALATRPRLTAEERAALGSFREFFGSDDPSKGLLRTEVALPSPKTLAAIDKVLRADADAVERERMEAGHA